MRQLTVRELRLAALDSLAQRSRCDTTRITLLYARDAWRPAHACALASRALALFAAAPSQEPYFARADSGRVRAIAVSREQLCGSASAAGVPYSERLAQLLYVIELEVPDRAYSIVVPLDADQLTGTVLHDIHPRGSMGSPLHLTVREWNSPDSLAEGAPCPERADAF